jgi:hypothetical protein
MRIELQAAQHLGEQSTAGETRGLGGAAETEDKLTILEHNRPLTTRPRHAESGIG